MNAPQRSAFWARPAFSPFFKLRAHPQAGISGKVREMAEEEAAAALALALRLDASCVREGDGESEGGGEGEGGPVAIFEDPRVRVDVADDAAVVLGFLQTLYLVAGETAQGATAARTLEVARAAQDAPEVRALAPIVDGREAARLEEGEVVTDVKWVNLDLFCAAYSSGIVRVFGRDGKLRFEQVVGG